MAERVPFADPDLWHPARLIPTAGIRGQEEQERRATSCLLAVMRAVPDFGRSLLEVLDAPKGRISTFAEVQLKDAEGRVSIPDGAIVIERGKTLWRCLVEVKTGVAELKAEQVSRYLDMARGHKFDAVLTISNQITQSPSESPVAVDKRRIKTVALRHLSWWEVITRAVVQHRHRGIDDADQAWILGELIAYLDHEASGASGFQDMGDQWVAVRNGARDGTLRPADAGVRHVAERWEGFTQYLCLGLSQDLGRDVRPARSRNGSPEGRRDALVKELATSGKLAAIVRVPDAIGPVTVEADLRTLRVTTSVAVPAPKDGRSQTRINWLLRQLADVPPDARLDVSFANTKETTSLLLGEAREFPQRLLSPTDAKREPRGFSVSLTKAMGKKRGRGEASFVKETKQQTIDFYREVVQNLRPWQAAAPKLPAEPDKTPRTPTAVPPPFSADHREIGDAVEAPVG